MKLNIKDFVKQSKNADILYLDSPNNPTGFQFSKSELQKLNQIIQRSCNN